MGVILGAAYQPAWQPVPGARLLQGAGVTAAEAALFTRGRSQGAGLQPEGRGPATSLTVWGSTPLSAKWGLGGTEQHPLLCMLLLVTRMFHKPEFLSLI